MQFVCFFVLFFVFCSGEVFSGGRGYQLDCLLQQRFEFVGEVGWHN